MPSVKVTPEYELCPYDLQWIVESVSDDFTLLDLFLLIHHAQQEYPQLPEMLGMAYFDAFYEEATRDSKSDDELHYLELYWHLSYDASKTKKKGERAVYRDCLISGELGNLMDFHGVGKHQCFYDDGCPNGCPEDDGYAIEMTPVNELVHLPIRMSPQVGIYEPWVRDDEKPLSRTGFTLTIRPTLYTFITSIFWELTFLGHPSDRDEQMADIQQSMEDIKSGKVKPESFDTDEWLENMDDEDDEDDESDDDS